MNHAIESLEGESPALMRAGLFSCALNARVRVRSSGAGRPAFRPPVVDDDEYDRGYEYEQEERDEKDYVEHCA
jgi:hypothetical protein